MSILGDILLTYIRTGSLTAKQQDTLLRELNRLENIAGGAQQKPQTFSDLSRKGYTIHSNVLLGSPTGDGFIEITDAKTSLFDDGPGTYIYSRQSGSNMAIDSKPIVALGNLASFLGLADGTYGLALGNNLWTASPTTSGFRGMVLDRINGINLYSTNIDLYNGALHTVSIQNDGDAFFGSDISTAANTSLVILSNAQTYNSESLGAGDILLGDNSASKANLLWDRSAGVLYFRGGTTSYANIGTNGTLTATNATISGTITATAGAIGGWTIETGKLSSGTSNIILDATNKAISINNATYGASGIQIEYNAGTPRLYVGNGSDKYLKYDGTNVYMHGGILTALQQGSEIGVQTWNTTCVFSSTDADTVSWTAGTFTLMDGTTYNITAGNTGNMTARTFIYLDIAVSTTAFQITTTGSNAVGSGKILIGIAQNSTTQAIFQIYDGYGGLKIKASDSIETGSIITDLLAANAVTAAKISVSQLSAISADMGSITAGTITGATIRTAASGARIEMTSSLLAGYATDGTTKEFYLQASDGKAYAGGGAVILDSDGIAIEPGAAYENYRSYKFTSGGVTVARWVMSYDWGMRTTELQTLASQYDASYTRICAYSSTGNTAGTFLEANCNDTSVVYLALSATIDERIARLYGSALDIVDHGLNVGSASGAGTGDVYGSGEIQMAGTGTSYVMGAFGVGTNSPSGSFAKVLNINDTQSGGNAALVLSQPTKKYSIAIVNTALRIYDETAAAYRVTIDTNGNVGIGTNTPSSSATKTLHIYNSGSAGVALENSVNKWSHFVVSTTGSYGFYDETNSKYRLAINTSGDVGLGGALSNLSTMAGASLVAKANGNVGIGTTTPGGSSTAGTGVLSLGNGTAPVGGRADQVSLFSKDVSSSAELFAMDEAGNTPQLTPHPSKFLDNLPLTGREYPWAYSAYNPYMGKRIDVDMMGAIRAIEKLSGEKFIYLEDLPVDERANWDAGQEAQYILRQQEIDAAKSRLAEIKKELTTETEPERLEELQKAKDEIKIPEPYIKKAPPKWMKLRGVTSKL